MNIREYTPADEKGWLICRVVSFLDCSYFNDVKTEKERYLQPSICLVAEDMGRIIGLIDAEIDSYDLACAGDDRGAIIWNLAVLPDYRKQGAARKLWHELKKRLKAEGVNYCEVWTQEDEAANCFYQSMGFMREESQTWLRCRANAAGIEKMLAGDARDGIFGVDELVFNAPAARREELMPLCDRMGEVRRYSIHI